MSHIRFTDRPGLAGFGIRKERSEIGTGEIEFDRDSFVFNQRTNSAEEIEAFIQRWLDFRAVSFTGNNGDGAPRGGRRNGFGGGQANLSEFQQWSACRESNAALEEVPPGTVVRFHSCGRIRTNWLNLPHLLSQLANIRQAA